MDLPKLNLNSLTDKEKAEFFYLHKLSDAKTASESLYEFAKKAWHIVEPMTKFEDGWHFEAMCLHLEAVARGEIQDLIINIPPRHTKSTLVSVIFPAWVWIERPQKKFIYASYAESLSIRDSIKCRTLVESNWYRTTFEIKWRLATDQNAKSRYKNTEGGERISTSVAGTITGEGGDIFVVDDPHNVKDASSETKRQAALDWWDFAVSSRGNDPKSFSKIVVMQRVHENDLTGHLIGKGGYEHLCLPAEYDPPREGTEKPRTKIGWEDPRETPGELLWPNRFGEVEIAKLKRNLGAQQTAAQLNQRPAPAEGNIFKRHWWRFYDVLPAGGLQLIIQSWDLTFDDKEKSSYVVGTVWGRIGADKYLLDMYRQRMNFNDQVKAVISMTQKWPKAYAKYVEKKANGAPLITFLKSKIPGLIPVEVQGSKLARAEAVSPQVEAGNVYLPNPQRCPWVEDFILEHTNFPNGTNNDIVDSTSQALAKLSERGVIDFNMASLTGKSKWL